MKQKANAEEVLKRLEDLMPLLQQRYGVVRIGLFGSTVREESAEDSDVDLLVKTEDPQFSLIDFVSLKHFLEESLGCRVDLVMEEALKPTLKEKVLNEVVWVEALPPITSKLKGMLKSSGISEEDYKRYLERKHS